MQTTALLCVPASRRGAHMSMCGLCAVCILRQQDLRLLSLPMCACACALLPHCPASYRFCCCLRCPWCLCRTTSVKYPFGGPSTSSVLVHQVRPARIAKRGGRVGVWACGRVGVGAFLSKDVSCAPYVRRVSRYLIFNYVGGCVGDEPGQGLNWSIFGVAFLTLLFVPPNGSIDCTEALSSRKYAK